MNALTKEQQAHLRKLVNLSKRSQAKYTDAKVLRDFDRKQLREYVNTLTLAARQLDVRNDVMNFNGELIPLV